MNVSHMDKFFSFTKISFLFSCSLFLFLSFSEDKLLESFIETVAPDFIRRKCLSLSATNVFVVERVLPCVHLSQTSSMGYPLLYNAEP